MVIVSVEIGSLHIGVLQEVCLVRHRVDLQVLRLGDEVEVARTLRVIHLVVLMLVLEVGFENVGGVRAALVCVEVRWPHVDLTSISIAVHHVFQVFHPVLNSFLPGVWLGSVHDIASVPSEATLVET